LLFGVLAIYAIPKSSISNIRVEPPGMPGCEPKIQTNTPLNQGQVLNDSKWQRANALNTVMMPKVALFRE